MEFIESINLSEFIALDLETSGLDSKNDKIIELSAYKFSNGKPVSCFTTLINPEININHKITSITGITNEMLFDKPTFDIIEDKFCSFIKDYPIVGHNILFDLSFLKANLRNYNKIFNSRMVCDTYYLSKIFYYNLSSFSLTGLCHSLNIPIKESHRAQEDAKNSGLLLIEIINNKLKKTNLHLIQQLKKCIDIYDVPNNMLFENIINSFIESNSLDNKMDDLTLEHPNFCTIYHNDNELNYNTLDDIFKKDGIIDKNLSNYEFRSNQLDFSKDIIKNIYNKNCLVAEAGAGLGKSYAYIFAGLLYCNENNSQLILSTNTHSLQSQLFNKDVPFAVKILNDNCKVTIIKGMNNYICLTRLNDLINNIESILNKYQAMELMSIYFWLTHTKTGDISECNGFNLNHNGYLWSLINSKNNSCVTYNCNANNGCFYRKIRESAKESKILIINHSMLISYYDKEESFFNDNSICIIDECHNFHSICQKQLSKAIDIKGFEEIRNSYESIINRSKLNFISDKKIGYIKNKIDNLFIDNISLMNQVFNDFFNHFIDDYSNSDYMSFKHINKDGIFLKNSNNTIELLDILNQLVKELSNFKDSLKNIDIFENKKGVQLDFEYLVNNLSEFYNLTDIIINNKDESINWFSYKYQNNSVSRMSINYCPSSLKETTNLIFDKFISTIFCSATLSTDKDFDFFIRQMGLEDYYYKDKLVTKKYLSPYYYNDQSKIFILNSKIIINEFNHIENVAKDIVDISNNMNKRILVLCTSFKQIDTFEKNINQMVPNHKNFIFQSKGKSKNILLSTYLEKKNSVLFGVNTFWEGIDLPKDKLEILIIFKIPFSNPYDPYIKSNIEYYQSKNMDGFMNYQVEDAILKLKQGFGRLIRSYEDMGVCIITDNRITQRKYGEKILNSLPVEADFYSSSSYLINETKKFLN